VVNGVGLKMGLGLVLEVGIWIRPSKVIDLFRLGNVPMGLVGKSDIGSTSSISVYSSSTVAGACTISDFKSIGGQVA